MTPRLKFLWTHTRDNGDRVDYFRHIAGPCVAVRNRDAIEIDGQPLPVVSDTLRQDVADALQPLVPPTPLIVQP